METGSPTSNRGHSGDWTQVRADAQPRMITTDWAKTGAHTPKTTQTASPGLEGAEGTWGVEAGTPVSPGSSGVSNWWADLGTWIPCNVGGSWGLRGSWGQKGVSREELEG